MRKEKIKQEDYNSMLEILVGGLRAITDMEIGETYTFSMDITIKDNKFSLVNKISLKNRKEVI